MPSADESQPRRCPECRSDWSAGATCDDHFHQMLFWENEFPASGRVHHLMVLSYYLQHPSLYSPAGLDEAKRLLVNFVENAVSPQEIRRRNQTRLDSSLRNFKIKASPGSSGAYHNPVDWTLTAADVVAGGPERYCDRVEEWAQSILAALKAAHNLAAG